MIRPEFQITTSRLQEQKEELKEILQIQKDCNLSFWSEDDYRKEINNRNTHSLTAKVNGKIQGFLVARKSGDSEIDVLNFGVSPKHQKCGIGSALWRKLVGEFFDRQVRTVWLEVRESNVNAINFYKNRGFSEIQRRKNFYTHPPEAAILMKLDVQLD